MNDPKSNWKNEIYNTIKKNKILKNKFNQKSAERILWKL